MSITVKGQVLGVTRGKEFDSKYGKMVTYTIEIDTEDGPVKVQKNSMSSTQFNLANGTNVSAEYEEQVVHTKTGKSFTNNKLVKDGLLIVSQTGEAQQLSASGTPRPTNNLTGKSSIYNNEGARNGMIVNASLALATARKSVTLEALKQAADDIKQLTQYVEQGVTQGLAEATNPVVQKKALKAAQANEVDTSPFESGSEDFDL